jgi:hypothetical protein
VACTVGENAARHAAFISGTKPHSLSLQPWASTCWPFFVVCRLNSTASAAHLTLTPLRNTSLMRQKCPPARECFGRTQ